MEIDCIAAADHKVGDLVLVSSAPEREFSLPGDDDPKDPVHGHLLVRSVEYDDSQPFGHYVYSLAKDKWTPQVYLVPARAVMPSEATVISFLGGPA